MGTPNSKVNFASFESARTSDINRLQNLASREAQNVLRDNGSSDPDINGVTGFIDLNGSTGQKPITGCDFLPSIAPIVSTFTATLGRGSAYTESATNVGADDSSYQVLRWAQQVVTFAAPSSSNPRIDLVYATLATVNTDPILTTILVDPTNRTVAQQTVNKTANPTSTIGVYTGTAAASPSADYSAIPADSIVLYEVYVPASALDSTSFGFTRQVFKRSSFPVSSYTGILAGCVPSWTLPVAPSTDDIRPEIQNTVNIGGDTHKVVIDGQSIQWNPTYGGPPTTYPDLANNPFGSAGPSGRDRPYYMYLVGGSNAPIADAGSFWCPMALVCSLSPPFWTGHSSADLQISRKVNGSNQTIPKVATCYVGIGFTAANTAKGKSCWIDGDWVYPNSPPGVAGDLVTAFENVAVFSGATSSTTSNIKFNSCPLTSSAIKLGVVVSCSAYGASDGFDSLTVRYGTSLGWVVDTAKWYVKPSVDVGDSRSPILGGTARISASESVQFKSSYSSATSNTVAIAAYARGYNMAVPRLGSGGI